MPRRTIIAASVLGAVALLGSACALKRDTPSSWREVGLPGAVLILQSDSVVEEIRFVGEAWAVITTGSKDGPMTGPVFPWGIENTPLKIGKNGEYELLEFVAADRGTVKAKRRNGAPAEYRLLKQ